MFLILEDGVLDFDLDSLTDILKVLDRQIEALETEVSHSPDPDSRGCFDRLEGVIGLGFVACQQYIHATYPQVVGKDKWRAIKGPPAHSSGQSVTTIINAAANYWKHHDEWPKKAVGVEDLDQEKLTPLLRLKYHDSIADAVADLGRTEDIRGVFSGFQKYLYQ